jgi:hypothetical protein
VSKPLFVGVVCVFLLASTPAAASFIEIGDAGHLTGTANMTDGAGPLTSILGNLMAPDPSDSIFDVDMFGIFISDPAIFAASTVGSPGLNVEDPQLFLFTSAGVGVFMNDDDPEGLNGSQSALGGLPFGFLSGLYYLAIGWWDNEPLSGGGDLIFDALTSLAVSPDPVADWNSNVLPIPDAPTAYEINLTGTLPSTAVAEPAEPVIPTIVALCIAALFAQVRARRQPTSLGHSPGTTPR